MRPWLKRKKKKAKRKNIGLVSGSVKTCLLLKHSDLIWIHRIHLNSWAKWDKIVTLGLERQDRDRSIFEAYCLTKPSLIMSSRFSERVVSKTKV